MQVSENSGNVPAPTPLPAPLSSEASESLPSESTLVPLAPEITLKDYIPTSIALPVFGLLLTSLIGAIWKYLDTHSNKNEQISQLRTDYATKEIGKNAEISELTKQKKDVETANEKLREQYETLIKYGRNSPYTEMLSAIENCNDVAIISRKYLDILTGTNRKLGGINEDLKLALQSSNQIIEEKLQDINKFYEYLSARVSSWHTASAWLERNIAELSEQATHFAFNKLTNESGSSSSNLGKAREIFQEDIVNYLELVVESLNNGRKNVLDIAFSEKLIEPVIDVDFYIASFEFIRNNRVGENLSDQVAASELRAIFDYLIFLLRESSL